MRLVVDANVIVALVLAAGERGPLEGHDAVAPHLLASEVTNTLSEMAFRGEIPPAAAPDSIARLSELSIEYRHEASLHRRAAEIARSLGWAKTYDAEYVALAELLELPLLTLDQRLRRRVADRIRVVGPVDLARERSSDGDQEGSSR